MQLGSQQSQGGLHAPAPATTVVVIGAGVSGLVCCARLLQYGLSVVVVERSSEEEFLGGSSGKRFAAELVTECDGKYARYRVRW